MESTIISVKNKIKIKLHKSNDEIFAIDIMKITQSLFL